ncbi:MAG: hypothetical protein AAGK21_07530 [Bacteroidota bacterium]
MRRRLLIATLLCAATDAGAQAGPLADLAERLDAQALTEASSVRITSRAALPDGDRRLRTRSVFSISSDRAARWEVTAGDATRTVWVTATDAASVVGDSATAMGESARQQVLDAMWLDPVVLLMRSWEVDAQALTDDLIQVEVPGRRHPVLIGLNASGLPVRITSLRDRGAKRQYVAVRFSDFRRVDGMLLPFRAVQTVDGKTTGEVTIERIDLDERLAGVPFDRE